MSNKIMLLVNPISGGKNKQAFISYFKEMAEHHKQQYVIHETNALGEYHDLREQLLSDGITKVAIAGGDGTVSHVLKELGGLPIEFGIIPCGSGNGLALAAQIPKDHKKAIELVFEGKAKTTDAFWVNNHFSVNVSGMGFDAQVAHDFAKQKRRGLITYTKESIKNYIRARPYLFEIQLPEINFNVEAYFITLANSNQFGNQFTIAPNASLHDGLIDIVIVKKMNKVRLPFSLLQQIRGKNKLQQIVDDLQHKNIVYFQVPHVTIVNKQLAPLHIDGEPVSTTETIEAEIKTDYFNLIC
jgi:diacylglycerol kinase (ATP)